MKIAIAAIATGLMLTGCSSADPDAARETAETNQMPVDRYTNEEYADDIREAAPSLSEVPTRMLVKNAILVCRGFDEGMTFNEVGMIFLESGMSPKEAGTLIGGAIAFKCPEHSDLLDNGSSV